MKRAYLLICGILLAAGPGRAEDSSALRKMFADPPRQYSSAPLWVWNDMLTEEQITGTLRDLASQKVKQAFVHPRPGLMTPYLSADWFRLWKTALREAERLDMNIWIYDENSYPSGFAGGWVPEVMPESRGRGLVFREEKGPSKPGKDVLGVYRLTNGGYQDVTAKARSGESLPEGKYLVAAVQRAGNSPWHGNRCYVDLMYPGVTEKFLEVTLEAYRREIGDQFGKRVPGSFTDEPNIRPAGLPWTEHLPAAFQKRWGYNLLDHLPSLARPVGPWKRVRHDYYQVLLDQFIEHWAKPYYDYCEKHGLEFTGHYWDHDWPGCHGVPDNMAMSAWQHRPGIDCLMNQYLEHTHAQFGNVRIAKEVSSVANQLGRKRTLCEIYGAGGWDLRFEDMKRIGDWLQVLGINTLDEHLSYVTIRGARKADHPQSFSYHEPWWPAYHVVSQYFTRLTAAMTQGEQINGVLVIEPTTTAWMYQGDGKRLEKIGKDFCDLLMSLEQAQVEYDIGCEDVIARHGSSRQRRDVDGGPGPNELFVGNRIYHTVVLPPGTETLRAETVKWLERWVQRGGRVICCGPPPAMVDARPSERVQKLAKERSWLQEPALDAVRSQVRPRLQRDGIAFHRSAENQTRFFHHRRVLDDGELLLLVNTSIDVPSAGSIQTRFSAAEVWDCHTGKIAPYPVRKIISHPIAPKQGAAKLYYHLPPCGSLLLFLTDKAGSPKPPSPFEKAAGGDGNSEGIAPPNGHHNGSTPHPGSFPDGEGDLKVATLQPLGPPEIRRTEPNVLALDYMDVTAGGETKKASYFHPANQFAFQKNGMDRNPWDSAVQFKDELITKKFPPQSGFQATYRFTIEGPVPQPLEIVIERPDLYTIACNGRPVSARPGAWWLDKSFGRIDITAAAKEGPNEVTIKAQPMTIYHELEPAYLLGDFSLRAAASGFVITPPDPLGTGAWDKQGHPFYAAGVTYREKFNLGQPAGRYRVALGKWYGSVARVTVNGKPAGYIAWQPWECDVTDLVQPGANTIEVTVIGTLKNTLGPHHAGKTVGSAWPGMFHVGPKDGPPPGEKYHTLGYGLFESFVVKHVSK